MIEVLLLGRQDWGHLRGRAAFPDRVAVLVRVTGIRPSVAGLLSFLSRVLPEGSLRSESCGQALDREVMAPIAVASS